MEKLLELAIAARDNPTEDIEYTDGNIHHDMVSEERHRLGNYCRDNYDLLIELCENYLKGVVKT